MLHLQLSPHLQLEGGGDVLVLLLEGDVQVLLQVVPLQLPSLCPQAQGSVG